MVGILLQLIVGVSAYNLEIYPSFPFGPIKAIATKDKFLYAKFGNMLEVLNISDPKHPIKVGRANEPLYSYNVYGILQSFTVGNKLCFRYANNYTGDFLLAFADISDPVNPRFSKHLFRISQRGGPVVVGRNFIYKMGNPIYTIDVSDSVPRITDVDTLFGDIGLVYQNGGVIAGDYLLAYYMGKDTIYVLSLSDPANPILVSKQPIPRQTFSLAYDSSTKYLYIEYCFDDDFPEYGFALATYDASNPANLIHLSTYTYYYEYKWEPWLFIHDGGLYEVGEYGRIRKYDLSNPANPVLVDSLKIACKATFTHFYKNHCYLMPYNYQSKGFPIVDLSSMDSVGSYTEIFWGIQRFLLIDDSTGYCLGPNPVGITILDLSDPTCAYIFDTLRIRDDSGSYNNFCHFLRDWIVVRADGYGSVPDAIYLVDARDHRAPRIVDSVRPEPSQVYFAGGPYTRERDSLILVRTHQGLSAYKLVKGGYLQHYWNYNNYHHYYTLIGDSYIYGFYQSNNNIYISVHDFSGSYPSYVGNFQICGLKYSLSRMSFNIRHDTLYLVALSVNYDTIMTRYDRVYCVVDISNPLNPTKIREDHPTGGDPLLWVLEITARDSFFYIIGWTASGDRTFIVSREFYPYDEYAWISHFYISNPFITPEEKPYFYLYASSSGLYAVRRLWVPILPPEDSTDTDIDFAISPNISRDQFNLFFTLPGDAHVKIKAYNVLGQMVDIIADERMNQGAHLLTWRPKELSQSLYLITVEVEGNLLFRARLIYLK